MKGLGKREPIASNTPDVTILKGTGATGGYRF